MSDSYKKYIDKAKKQKANSEDSKKKQDKEFTDLYKQYHLKYSSGGQIQESQQSRYQAKDYFGKDDGADSGETLGRFSDGSLNVGSQSESPSYYADGTDNAQSDDHSQPALRQGYGDPQSDLIAQSIERQNRMAGNNVTVSPEEAQNANNAGQVGWMSGGIKNVEGEASALASKFADIADSASDAVSQYLAKKSATNNIPQYGVGAEQAAKNLKAPPVMMEEAKAPIPKFAFGTPNIPMYKPPMAVMPAHMPAVPKFTGGIKHMKRFADGATPDQVSNNAPIDPSVIETFKKYFNTPSPTPVPGPSLEDKYKKIREDNSKQFSGKAYSEGGKVEKDLELGQHAKDYEYKNGVDPQKNKQERSPASYIEYNNPDKFPGVVSSPSNAELNNPEKYNKGTIDASPKTLPVNPSTNPGNRSQAMKNTERNPFHFDDGTPGVPPATPSYPVDSQKIQSAQQSMRDAFHFARGSANVPAHEVFHKYMALFGGLPKVPNAHHMPNPLAENKIPLNIPRGGKIKFPKRLKSVSNIEGFADGTDSVPAQVPMTETPVDDSDDAMIQKYRALGLLKGPTVATGDQAMVTGSPSGSPSPAGATPPVVPADLGPYPGEDEEANKTSDDSSDAEIQKAADDKDEEPKKKRVVNLKGDTLTKEEALKDDEDKEDDEVDEDKDKELEDEYKGEEEKADKEATKAKDLEESEDDKKDSDKVEDKEDAKEVLEKPVMKNDNGPMQKLMDAQAQQRNNNLINQLGKITDKMGASMGHFQAQNQGIYDTNLANADLPVKQLEQQMAMEKYDPNSNTSKAFRQYLGKFGGQDVKALGNISMAQAESIAPYAVKDFESKQAFAAKAQDLAARNKERMDQTHATLEQRAQQAREHNDLMRELASQKNESAKEAKEAKQSASDQAKKDKIDAKDVDRVDKMNKSINAEMSNGRSAFGIAAKNRQAVDNAQALINGEADLNNLDNRQVVETARTLDRVLSGGNSTISGSEHLTPESARSWIAKKMEYITNQRQGAQAGSFLKTMAATLDREGKQADKQILKAQNEFMGPYKGLAKNDKDSRSYQNYINTLKANHLDALLPKDEQEEQSATPIPGAKPIAPNEVKRITKDGRTAIFDSGTKKFLRYE